MYGSGSQIDLYPIGPHEIDRPPPLPDFAPCQPRREFRSGSGLLCPFEFGLVFPERQHQHRKFPRGRDSCLGEAASP